MCKIMKRNCAKSFGLWWCENCFYLRDTFSLQELGDMFEKTVPPRRWVEDTSIHDKNYYDEFIEASRKSVEKWNDKKKLNEVAN